MEKSKNVCLSFRNIEHIYLMNIQHLSTTKSQAAKLTSFILDLLNSKKPNILGQYSYFCFVATMS